MTSTNLSEELLVERLKPRHLEEYLDLYRSVFSRDVPDDILFRKSRGWGDSIEFLAYGGFDSRGALAAALSFFPRVFRRGSESLMCVEAGDGMVSEKFRGRGVFGQLVAGAKSDLAAMKIPLMYGFPNQLAYPAWRKIGAHFPNEIVNYTFVLALGSVLERKVTLPSILRAALDSGTRKLMMRKNPAASMKVLLYRGVPSSLAATSERPTFANRYERHRTEAYIRWRFASYERDDGEFFTMVIEDSQKERAFFVLLIKTDDSLSVYDFWCDGPINMGLAFVALSRQGVYTLNAEAGLYPNRILIADLAGNTELTKALQSAGFISRRTGHHLMLYPTSPEYEEIVVNSEWHMLPADSDFA